MVHHLRASTLLARLDKRGTMRWINSHNLKPEKAYFASRRAFAQCP